MKSSKTGPEWLQPASTRIPANSAGCGIASGGPWRQMFFKVARQQREKMELRPRAFGERMSSSGVFHEIKRLAEFDETVDEQLRALEMHIVVSGTVHDEEIPLKALDEIYYRP